MEEKKFSEQIREAIAATGKTMREVSDLIGVPYRTIQDYRAGRHEPSGNITKTAILESIRRLREMNNISEMTGNEIRYLFGIESVSDAGMSAFEAWDKKHPHRDYYSADSRRADIAEGLTNIGFDCECDDEEIKDIYDLFWNDTNKTEAAIKLADELINTTTYSRYWDLITEYVEDYREAADGYAGIDAYVECAKYEFAAELYGSGISIDKLTEIFNGESWESLFRANI